MPALKEISQERMPSFVKALKFARRTNGTRAHFQHYVLQNPLAEGTFKLVTFGTFAAGDRKGETAVGKWIKRSICDDENALTMEIKIARKALQIIAAFNCTTTYHKTVVLNLPEIWCVTTASHNYWKDAKLLIEPYIDSFQKYNSNNVSIDPNQQ